MGFNLMDSPISKFTVLPFYDKGFFYMWEIIGSFNDPIPWVFTVQESPSPSGEWRDISEPIENRFFWKEESSHRRINKSAVLYYRLKMVSNGKTYFSGTIQPYGDLNRKEFLLARDIMRRETLHCEQMAGMFCDVYSVSNFGPRCHHCLDPITGQVRDSKCKHCFGTGRDPAYHGPFGIWMSFSSDANHKYEIHQDGNGTAEPKQFSIRAICSIVMKKNDVVIDRSQDKRYYVHEASMVSEIRRVPLIQNLIVAEAPVTDVIYKL